MWYRHKEGSKYTPDINDILKRLSLDKRPVLSPETSFRSSFDGAVVPVVGHQPQLGTVQSPLCWHTRTAHVWWPQFSHGGQVFPNNPHRWRTRGPAHVRAADEPSFPRMPRDTGQAQPPQPVRSHQ